MKYEHTITDADLLKIIHNIAEDFRHSGEYEKFAQLFYAVDADSKLDAKRFADMVEYVTTSLEELQKDLAWRKTFLGENPHIQERQMTQTMQTIEQEYKALTAYFRSIEQEFSA